MILMIKILLKMQLQQCKQFSVLEPVKIKSDEMISEKIKLSINF